ncbi:aminoglycoside phosphotransferase family protein [Paenibacillus thiaminolyticus]|uniref:phosphotransferase family protein n=1 Tax=Paenibacillus thiaminolyticus TaxID=49283 RepID=UPI003D2BE4DD
MVGYERKLLDFLHREHPDIFNYQPVNRITSGTANIVFITGGDEPWVFRFPRTDNEFAIGAMQREIILMPLLVDNMPIHIPRFKYMSSDASPYVYVGYPMLQGEHLDVHQYHALDSQQQMRLSQDIGNFLSALHSFHAVPYFPSELFHNNVMKQQQQFFYELFRQDVASYLSSNINGWIDTVYLKFLSDSDRFSFSPCLIHGDLKTDHIIFNHEKRVLSGIIDLGLKIGDPAYDLGLLPYGNDFIEGVLDAYKCPIDAYFRERVQFYFQTRHLFALRHSVIHNDKKLFNDCIEAIHEIMKQST